METGVLGQAKGELLEGRRDEIVREVCAREGLDPADVDVWSNVLWNDKAEVGEVDLALRCRGKVVLVECKARTFDVMDGWLQSSAERAENKTHLQLGKESVRVPDGTPCYVVTVLPEHPYVLKFESLAKRITTMRSGFQSPSSDSVVPPRTRKLPP